MWLDNTIFLNRLNDRLLGMQALLTPEHQEEAVSRIRDEGLVSHIEAVKYGYKAEDLANAAARIVKREGYTLIDLFSEAAEEGGEDAKRRLLEIDRELVRAVGMHEPGRLEQYGLPSKLINFYRSEEPIYSGRPEVLR